MRKREFKTCYENRIFETKNFGDVIVTKYIDSYNVHVKFLDTGYETVTQMSNVREGNVKDKLAPSVYNVGVIGDEIIKIDGEVLKVYRLWRSVLQRCYDKNTLMKRPTYVNCTVSDNFRYFPYFKEWCSKQIGFNVDGWDLDKDILLKGNRVYSEDTCCFVPREVNSLFTKSNKTRGNLPIGVSYKKHNEKFSACLRKYGKLFHIGYFTTEIEAFHAYKEAKEAYVKEVANKWKGVLDTKVYVALMNYQVEITD